MSVWAISLLGVMVKACILWVLFCFPSWLYCPLRFQNSPQTRWWEDFLVFGNFSFVTPSLEWVSVPNSFVSLFVFYILSYLLSKRMGCLSGCLVSSTSIQNLFCGTCSAFKWSFDEFVEGESGLPVLFLRHLRAAVKCWVLSQLFHSPLSLSWRGTLVLLFLP